MWVTPLGQTWGHDAVRGLYTAAAQNRLRKCVLDDAEYPPPTPQHLLIRPDHKPTVSAICYLPWKIYYYGRP